MPPAVRTRRSTVVPLPSAGGTGSPSVDVVVPLSPLDTRWAALPPVCHVFLFPAAAHQQQVPFSDVVRGLKSSLAAVLPAFHTLAGELAYSPELGTVTIVCGEDAGVAFVEAETDLDLASLVVEDDDGTADLDLDALPQLVPDIRREVLPAPMFAAQVTEFARGIALGVALNHVATDGIGFFRFMQMWPASAVAAGATSSDCTWTWTEPLHDRRFVRFDGDQELARRLLRQAAPDLPRIVPKQQGATPHRPLLLSRRTFTFSAHALRRLKQRLTAAVGPGVVGAAAPSTFATLAAHGWVSFALASGFTDAAPVFAVFLADCRAHMSPRVPDAYAGNCVISCVVALGGAELTGADGPALAFLAIRDAAVEVKRDPLAGSGSWITRFRAAPPGRKVVLAGSPRFPAYAVDFGFGRPARVERASLDEDGAMAIFAGREAGSVQASVAVTAGKMPVFHRTFAVKSGSNKARL
ncbi:BAHD acyltransferase DCR-like [Miscanthus floridulus]|uniref:BAHD acyltransferase DCR-like n=1 Tax=Miscanthus floridulus TaxID=154761 RepID=UPI00345ACE6E